MALVRPFPGGSTALSTPTLHYADLLVGRIHYCSAGRGPAVLLIHHTPRSWTYYRALLPLLAVDRKVVAFDSPGFGSSEAEPGQALSIELFAEAALALLDHLEILQCDVVGAMTGACVAVDLATRAAGRVRKVVLVSPPMFLDAEDKERELARVARQRSGAPDPDGSHALRFWDMAVENWQWDVGLPLDAAAYELARDFTVDSLRAGANCGQRGQGRLRLRSRRQTPEDRGPNAGHRPRGSLSLRLPEAQRKGRRAGAR